MALSHTDRVDTWLRGQGLPYLVPRSRRAADLLQRTAPAVVLLIGQVVFEVLGGGALGTLFDSVGASLGSASGALLVAILALSILAPVVAAVWIHRAMRRWSDARGRSVALALIAAYAALAAIVGTSATAAAAAAGTASAGDVSPVSGSSVVADLAFALGSVVALHLLVWSGVGSVLLWAARWAWQSLSAVQNMASRALPVILVLVVFAFFSTEPWQIADSLGLRRQWALTAVIALIAVLAMIPVARSEVDHAHEDLTEEQAHDLLEGTPLAGAPTGAVSSRTLSRTGRVNVLAVLVLAHLIQAAMFTLVVAGLLVTIGRIAITDAVVKSWLTHPRDYYTFLGDPLPLDHQTVRTAFLLGAIGALSFVLSSLSDQTYRNLFFDPLLERVRVAVAAHRALTSEEGTASMLPRRADSDRHVGATGERGTGDSGIGDSAHGDLGGEDGAAGTDRRPV